MRKKLVVALVFCILGTAGSAQAAPGFTKAGTPPPPPPEDGVWLPAHSWLDALRAGGVVNLGPGTFMVTEVLELDRSLTVTGAGPEETLLSFGTDGGEYGEQLALLEGDGNTRFRFADLGIFQSNEAVSDLVTVFGQVNAEFDNVSLGLAWDGESLLTEGDNYYGVGLYAAGGANLRVVNSSIYGNGSHGIGVWDDVTLFVNNSEFVLNWIAGIYAVDSAVTVINSHFEMNEVGIEIYGTHPRTLASNTFDSNEWQDVFEE